MKIGGRKIKLKHLLVKARDLTTMLRESMVFNDLPGVWRAYLKRQPPSGNFIQLKDKKKIFLSSNPHDIVTVMVIFTRKEYGEIPKDGVVIDVGANIGVFSMYAAMHGARKIYAFEPCKEAYDVLVKNIKENGLEDVIIPFKNAVTERDGDFISIPKSSSPYNAISFNTSKEDDRFEQVETMSLPTLINNYKLDKIDLLKMDCEGAEFGIIPNMPPKLWERISKFKLEFHDLERREEIVSLLKKFRFKNTLFKNMILWFEK